MKKILVGGGIVTGIFILLVGVIFGVLSYLEQPPEQVQLKVAERNNSLSIQMLKQKMMEVDSLSAELQKVQNNLFFNQLERDSLVEQLEFKDNLISGYNKTIDGLNSNLLSDEKRDSRVKDLAKTFESMKTSEMAPILENVDDATVIDIYKNMNSRVRKNVLMALPDKRASRITQKLADGFEPKAYTKNAGYFTPEIVNAAHTTISLKDDELDDRSVEKIVSDNKPASEPVSVKPDSLASDKSDSVKHNFSIQLFYGKDPVNAQSVMVQAKTKLQVPVFIESNKGSFKVLAGKFETRDQATAQLGKVQDGGFADAFIVSPKEKSS